MSHPIYQQSVSDQNSLIHKHQTSRTALLVLNYKKFSDSENLLRSVIETKLTDVDIIILDNASGNESIVALGAWIDSNFPRDANNILETSSFKLEEEQLSVHVKASHVKGRVALFSSDKNYGFSGGNNVLAHIGRQLGYKFLYLLNSDIIFTDRFAVSKLEALHDADSEIFASGPCVINLDGTFDSPYRRDTFWGDAFYYGPLNRLRGLFGLPTIQFDFKALSKPYGVQVYKISGAAMFFSTDKFFELRGLDENVWLSSEEAILGEKVRKKGGKIVFLPTTVLLHVKASAPRPKSKKVDTLSNHFIQRNYYYLKYRNFTTTQMAILRVGQLFRIFMARL